MLRTRARRRLIGATVLVAVAVIGLPLLFESQPRPLPSDLQIDLQGRDGATGAALATPAQTSSPPTVAEKAAPAADPAVVAASRAEPPVVSERAAESTGNVPSPSDARHGSDEGETPATAPTEHALALVAAPRAPHPDAAPAATGHTLAPGSTADAARAKALLDGKPVAAIAAQSPVALPATATAAGTRYIVQVGAYADADAVTAARSKAERSGMKTYTQVIQTPGGARTRVRVGPYASRGEADRALAQLKSAGLPAVVLALEN